MSAQRTYLNYSVFALNLINFLKGIQDWERLVKMLQNALSLKFLVLFCFVFFFARLCPRINVSETWHKISFFVYDIYKYTLISLTLQFEVLLKQNVRPYSTQILLSPLLQFVRLMTIK